MNMTFIVEAYRKRLNPWFWIPLLLAAAGCSEAKKVAPSVNKAPVLEAIQPRLRTIVRVVGQPSFVQSYERTSIYPKITAFVEKWNVDIGDKVRKGDVLADLFVPELSELWGSKKATVEYDKEQVKLMEEEVKVAAAEVKAAMARLDEAKSILGKYEAEVQRWYIQVNRLGNEVHRQVVAPQILLESNKELNADLAARDAAKAAIVKREAELLADEAALSRAKVNVAVARARVVVAESEAKRIEAWVGYMKLFAPFDGIVVERNANTWDFVLPTMGDPTAEMRSPHEAPGAKAAPIYVIDRTDIIRVFVDIPERDADYVHIGSDARVKLWAYKDAWQPATVTRLAWALNTQSRTMRAEIDLPNPGGRILPGMYAYGKIIVERPNVLALPKSVLSHAGGKTFIWLYDSGRAKRTEIQTGAADGDWIEATNRRVESDNPYDENWTPMEGSEQVLFGKTLSTLSEGDRVVLAGNASGDGENSHDSKRDLSSK